MTKAAIGREVHQALDVHRSFATKIAFHRVIGVDRFADVQDFCVRQILNATGFIDVQLGDDFLGFGLANTMDILKYACTYVLYS